MSDAVFDGIREILRDTLQLGEVADHLTESSSLIGGLPELDSMAIVAVLTAIEEQFGITIEDDAITASDFSTVGTLCSFVKRRKRSE